MSREDFSRSERADSEVVSTYKGDSDRISTLYGISRIISRRFPNFSTMRGRTEDCDSSDGSYNMSRSSSSDFSVIRSPPPVYTSKVSVCSSDPESEEERSGCTRSATPVRSRPGFLNFREARFFAISENESGIRWKFANQGLSLLDLSSQESSTITNGSSGGLPALTRQLYTHGLTYLLRGLPLDLSNEEKISIYSSLPNDVLEVGFIETSRNEVVPVGRLTPSRIKEPPSILHRVLASIIVQCCLFIQLLLPYLRFLLSWIYQFERQHHISEKVFSSGMTTMDGVLKGSIQIGDSMCRMNDGKVGHAVGDVIVWWIGGVAGGIHQGLREGLAILGLEAKVGARTGGN